MYLGTHGKVWVQRPVNTAYLPEYLVQAPQLHPPKIGIFACFSGHGVSEAGLVDGSMNARKYTSMLGKVMKPFSHANLGKEGWMYAHDNAPYH